jgi:multiple sugar transport system permease protein
MSTPTQPQTEVEADAASASGLARVRELWNEYLPYWFTIPMVLVMVLITFFPGAYTLYLSLIEEPTLNIFAAEFVGLEHFETAFTRGGALHSFVITVTVVASALLLESVLGFVLAALVAGVGCRRAVTASAWPPSLPTVTRVRGPTRWTVCVGRLMLGRKATRDV